MSGANKRVREQLIARSWPLRCRYCGSVLTDKTATLDHVKPLVDGGKTNMRNCVLACAPCNNLKADGADIGRFVGNRALARLVARKSVR